MLKSPVFRCLVGAICLTTLAVYAISAGEMDDFQDGTTENWGHGTNTGLVTNVPDGGPNGAGDGFLRVESTGNPGSGGRLVVLNEDQWTGDYNAIGDTFTISMDLVNLGPGDLDIRLGIEAGFIPQAVEGKGEQWVSTTSFFLPATSLRGATWQHTEFELSVDGLTQVLGGQPLSVALDDVGQMRILSATSISWQGDQVAAVLGIDNIRVESTPVELQSFSVE